MNRNTSKILIYAVIFLAVLNVATFISIGININNAKKELPQASSEAIKTAQNFNGRYFRDQLNLSPTQMDHFRVVNDHFRSNARRINNELNILRSNMMKEMKQAACDSSKLNIQSDSIGMLHADLKKLTYKYYMGIKGFCTAEQIQELNNIFEQFFNTGQHHHEHGHGNQQQGLRRQGHGYGFGRGRSHINNDSIN